MSSFLRMFRMLRMLVLEIFVAFRQILMHKFVYSLQNLFRQAYYDSVYAIVAVSSWRSSENRHGSQLLHRLSKNGLKSGRGRDFYHDSLHKEARVFPSLQASAPS